MASFKHVMKMHDKMPITRHSPEFTFMLLTVCVFNDVNGTDISGLTDGEPELRTTEKSKFIF